MNTMKRRSKCNLSLCTPSRRPYFSQSSSTLPFESVLVAARSSNESVRTSEGNDSKRIESFRHGRDATHSASTMKELPLQDLNFRNRTHSEPYSLQLEITNSTTPNSIIFSKQEQQQETVSQQQPNPPNSSQTTPTGQPSEIPSFACLADSTPNYHSSVICSADEPRTNPFLISASANGSLGHSQFKNRYWRNFGGSGGRHNKQTLPANNILLNKKSTLTTHTERLKFSKSWNCPVVQDSSLMSSDGVSLRLPNELHSTREHLRMSEHAAFREGEMLAANGVKGTSLLSAVFAIRKLSLSDEHLPSQTVTSTNEEALQPEQNNWSFNSSLLRFQNGSLSPERAAPTTPKIHLELPKTDAQSEYNREFLW